MVSEIWSETEMDLHIYRLGSEILIWEGDPALEKFCLLTMREHPNGLRQLGGGAYIIAWVVPVICVTIAMRLYSVF